MINVTELNAQARRLPLTMPEFTPNGGRPVPMAEAELSPEAKSLLGAWKPLILVSPAMEPKPNDDVLLKRKNEALPQVRRLVLPRATGLSKAEGSRWFMFMPLNHRYPPEIVREDEIESMHKVRRHVSPSAFVAWAGGRGRR